MQKLTGEKSKTNEYYSLNFWLESCDDDLAPRPMLEESKTADIAVLGAGFTGLWTSYYLLRQDPALKIVILEKDIVGFGASGRNGGSCSPNFSVTPSMLMKRYGEQSARELQQALFDSVHEIGNVIKDEGLNTDWTLGGKIRVALGDHNVSVLEKEMNDYKKLGLDDHFLILNKKQLEKHIRIQEGSGGLFMKDAAVLHPGKLVRGLAKLLESRGVKIFEKTEVKDIKKGSVNKDPKLITSHASIKVKKAVVIAGEAYLSELPEFKRNLIPMYSSITLTEPISDEQWRVIGCPNREQVGSTRLSVDYMQRTADNRILFGGRGAPYRFNSKIKNSFDYHKKTHKMLKQMVMDRFPMISEVKFTHSWGGPVGVTRDWMPTLFFDKKTRIAGSWGYAGSGLSTTNLAGNILSDLINGNDSAIAQLPMVNHKSKRWEPEPFRWLGVRHVQHTLERVDKKSELKGIAPQGNTLGEWLSRH